MTKREFLQQYILTRTSHKRKIEELLADAEKAWSFIESSI
jgi:hypothetical protein